MDYSNRVNSKKGSGGVADSHETNIHTRRRLQELLTTQVIDIENDPYVFRNHLGFLECRLCLTTHVSESSYISHLAGKKHQLNMEKRRILDNKYNKSASKSKVLNLSSNVVSISNTPKRNWEKIGKPAFKVTKIRDPTSFQLGILINVKFPLINSNVYDSKSIVKHEPLFRFMNYYELSTKNQNITKSYFDKQIIEQENKEYGSTFQYVIISCEPYENICVAIPNREIDKPADSEMSDSYWWYFDQDTKEFFLQFLYKQGEETE